MVFSLMAKRSRRGRAPGLVDGRLAPLSSKPNCVSSEESTPEKKRVDPFSGVTLEIMSAAIMETGGVIKETRGEYLRAEYTSKHYGFVDDVELRMEGDMVHIRSASRVGYSDRGVNRARVNAIRQAVLRLS